MSLLYKKIFDYIKSPVVIANTETIIDTNRAFLEFVKLTSKSELLSHEPYKDSICQWISSGENKVHTSITDSLSNTLFVEISISSLQEDVFLLEFKLIEDEALYNEITIISTYNRELFNNSIDAVAIVDNNSKIIDVNNAFMHIFEYTRLEAIGYDIDTLIVPENERQIAKSLFQRVLNQERVEVIAQRCSKNGRTVDVKAVAYPVLIDKRINGNYVIYKDITEEKTKDRLLIEKDDFLKQLFNRSLFPIAILDREERVLEVNSKFEVLFGFSNEEITGKAINPLIVPPQYEREAIQFKDVILNQETMMAKTKRMNKAGELLDVEAVGSPVVMSGEVAGFFAMYRDIRLEEQALAELRVLINTDTLTGLFNRNYIYKSIMETVETVAIDFSLIYFDLDKFKRINDDYGHEVGDQLLVEVARRLKQAFNTAGTLIARIGGDEFLMVCSCNDRESLVKQMEQLKRCIEEPFKLGSLTLTIASSIGYSQYPEEGEDIDHLISLADFRMYEEKKRKRIAENPVRKDPSMASV